jgi:tripartite-type tricarboxylate transporter receptor subunit TctC
VFFLKLPTVLEERLMHFRTAAIIALLVSHAGSTFAQGYPSRPVRVIVPFPPGQTTDVSARIVADKLSQSLGQPFVIVNQPGAGGQIGTQAVVNAAPDGYTLLGAGSGPVTVLPALQKVPYDSLTQLAPISLTSFVAFALVAHPSFPARSTVEFITLIRTNPEKHTYSSSGTGTTAHLTTEYFNALAGLKARYVPFNGSTASLNAILGQQIDYTFEGIPAVINFTKSARLKTFGVSSLSRLTAMPDVQTISESGDPSVTSFEMIAWLGYLGPAGLPPAIAEQLSAEITKALKSPEVAERYKGLGMETLWSTPAEMLATMQRDKERYGAIAKRANIKLD